MKKYRETSKANYHEAHLFVMRRLDDSHCRT